MLTWTVAVIPNAVKEGAGAMEGTFQDWINQLTGIHNNPPDNVPAERLDEFKQHVQHAIDEARKGLADAPEFARVSLAGLNQAATLERVMTHFTLARQCCVYEKRRIEDPGEYALALVTGGPTERLYPKKVR